MTWLALLLFALPATAGDAGPVRVYTNADLEAFPAPESSAAAAGYDPAGDLAFVREFLERQYDRLDAERELDLARRRLEAEAGALEVRSPRPLLAPLFFAPYPYFRGAPGDDAAQAPLYSEQGRIRAESPHGRITPIHSRPAVRPAPVRCGR